MIELLAKAEELALSNQCSAAADIYEEILAEGAEPQADILYNLVSTLTKAHRFARALSAAEALCFFAPRQARSWLSLNHLQNKLGYKEAALASLYRALELEPTNESIQDSRLFLLAQKLEPAAYRQEAEAAARPVVRSPPPVWDRQAAFRLRIGYVSGDMRVHVMDRFIEALIKYHSKSADVTFFDNSPIKDAKNEEFHHQPWPVYDINGRSDQQVTDLIHSLGIDVLVDLSGLSAHHRQGVFALRPAPVQVTGIGFLPTTGAKYFDWRLADYEEQEQYTEPLFHLARAAVPMPLCPEIPVTPLPAERNGFLTFGYVNGLHKLNDESIRRFVQVVESVPDSRLLIMLPGASDSETAAMILRRFDPIQHRVLFTESQGGAAFCKILEDIDVALDPAPCGGMTTTVDCLFHGVPVLTMGYSDRRISADAERLQQQMLNRSSQAWHLLDIPALADVRRALRPAYLAHPVGDPRGWVATLEESYHSMAEQRLREAA